MATSFWRVFAKGATEGGVIANPVEGEDVDCGELQKAILITKMPINSVILHGMARFQRGGAVIEGEKPNCTPPSLVHPALSTSISSPPNPTQEVSLTVTLSSALGLAP